MNEPHKTIDFSDGRTLQIHQDIDPMNPRTEFDNLGTMACFHKRSIIGDENHGINHNEFGGWDEMEKWIRHANPDCVILPVYMYEHSGQTINTTGFSCPWDSGQSGQIGFIFVSREKINAEYGAHGRTDAQIEEYLRGEIALYDQYLMGDVWGFIILDKPCVTCGETREEIADGSCWGFYGDDPLENGMVDHFDPEYRDALMASDGVLKHELADNAVKVV